MSSTDPDQLTPKGQATRTRIVVAAAQLIYEHGVKATNNEMVRRAAGVSGSQLSHYFSDKEQLVRAVIDHQIDAMRGRLSTPPREPLDSIDALQSWATEYIDNPAVITGGCSFGSLASEVLKSEPGLHDAIRHGFALWSDDFRSGLQAMQDNGALRSDAPIDTLVHTLTAAFQGGLLLVQASGDIAPLRDTLNSAIDAVRQVRAPGSSDASRNSPPASHI